MSDEPPAADVRYSDNPSCASSRDMVNGDRDRIARVLGDTVVHQMFAVSLDLSAALVRIDDHHAAEKVHRAIEGLDQAINDLRKTVFDSGAAHTAERHFG